MFMKSFICVKHGERVKVRNENPALRVKPTVFIVVFCKNIGWICTQFYSTFIPRPSYMAELLSYTRVDGEWIGDTLHVYVIA